MALSETPGTSISGIDEPLGKEKAAMKTQEELNTLKAEIEALNRKLAELTEEELALVTGGDTACNWGKIGDDWDKYVCDF